MNQLKLYNLWQYCYCIIISVNVILIWITMINAVTVAAQLDDIVEVEIDSGRILGRHNVTLFKEKPYYSFRGIPYAQPPINDLRFKVSN